MTFYENILYNVNVKSNAIFRDNSTYSIFFRGSRQPFHCTKRSWKGIFRLLLYRPIVLHTKKKKVFFKNCSLKGSRRMFKILKEIGNPKIKICHHLLTLKLFQTCISLFCWTTQKKIFWQMPVTKQLWSTKILWKAKVPTVWLPAFFKISSFVFRTTWGRVNVDRIFILEWTIPLTIIGGLINLLHELIIQI